MKVSQQHAIINAETGIIRDLCTPGEIEYRLSVQVNPMVIGIVPAYARIGDVVNLKTGVQRVYYGDITPVD